MSEGLCYLGFWLFLAVAYYTNTFSGGFCPF